jgi:predicted RNase H-like HicB family nuclease
LIWKVDLDAAKEYIFCMKNQFTAIIERGEEFLIATCPEVPEAHGQGASREECLRDLAGSIESVLDYRREEALANLRAGSEKAVVEVV